MARSSKYQRIFSNGFTIRAGDNDVTLGFGYVEDPADVESLEEEVGVVMTPRTLKILANNLRVVLEMVESTSGEIAVPAGKMYATPDDMIAAGKVQTNTKAKPTRKKAAPRKKA